MVRGGEALESGTHRWLADDEPDPRRLDRPAVGVAVVPQPAEARRPGQGQERGRGALAEAPEVLAETRLDRALGARVQPLDEPAHAAERLLEGEPRVALPELRPALWSDMAGRDAQRRALARSGAEPARGQDRVEQCEPEGGHHGRRPEVALDPLEDGSETHQLAGRVEVEQLVGQALGAGDRREAGKEGGPHGLRADVGADALEVVRVERSLPELRAAALVATDRAAVMPGGRSHPPCDARLVVHGPDDLVDDQRPAAGRAARREHVADGDLETRLTPR